MSDLGLSSNLLDRVSLGNNSLGSNLGGSSFSRELLGASTLVYALLSITDGSSDGLSSLDDLLGRGSGGSDNRCGNCNFSSFLDDLFHRCGSLDSLDDLGGLDYSSS